MATELTRDDIRSFADRTNPHCGVSGPDGKNIWMNARLGRLTSSNFGRAICAIRNPQRSTIDNLRADIYAPRKIDFIPAVRWGTEHEPVALSAYINKTGAIIRTTGVWLYKNGLMGASPDGLVMGGDDASEPLAVIEVKCPYSMRNVKLKDPSKGWPRHLKYLDLNDRLKRNHYYYHQIQGSMHAVEVDWCDFIIWTPCQMLIQTIQRDVVWGEVNLPRLESFFNDYLAPSEYEDPPMDTNEEGEYIMPKTSADLVGLMNASDSFVAQLRDSVYHAIAVHMARLIYHRQSQLHSGLAWKPAVYRYWDHAATNICEYCVRKLFSDAWYAQASIMLRGAVSDHMWSIMNDEVLWATLLCDAGVARMIMERIKMLKSEKCVSAVPCTCAWRKLCGDGTNSGFNIYTVLATPPTRNITTIPWYAIFSNGITLSRRPR